jgi:hypothetical protein
VSAEGLTLTEAERESLKVALYGNRAKTLTLEGGPVCEAVESILTARLAQAKAEALRDVEALHAPVRMYPEARFAPWCAECSQGFTAGGDDPPSQRRVSWPCATAKAADLVDPLAPSPHHVRPQGA